MKCMKAREEDSLQIAKLHKECIPTGFLSQQSLKFLNALYLFLITHEIVYVVKEEEKVIGFVAVSLNRDGLLKRFIKNNFGMLFKFIMKNLFSIDFIKKALETFTSPKKTAVDEEDYEVPELLSIVINESYGGKGYGKSLLDCLEQELRSSKVKEYKVVAGSMLKANKFYAKNGFTKIKEIELHKGVISYLYLKTL